MNRIFIGGSRHVSQLPAEVKQRLDNVIDSGHDVIVGDANGADKAIQKYFLNKNYNNVTVFCSGETPRNNLGMWTTHHVDAPKSAKGFDFFAAKDREMAREADFGLMIWDGESPGTILNVLRLTLAGKIAVLFNVPERNVVNVKSIGNWKTVFQSCSSDIQTDIKKRATSEEWRQVQNSDQHNLLEQFNSPVVALQTSDLLKDYSEQTCKFSFDHAVAIINKVLLTGDATAVANTLGAIAREKGMTQVARKAGLARESLYRSLDVDGNPEFATILKVISAMGLKLEVKVDSAKSKRAR